MAFTTYKNLSLHPSPTGDAGIALNNNFTYIADTLGSLLTSTSLATPSTLALRDGSGGIAFGSLTAAGPSVIGSTSLTNASGLLVGGVSTSKPVFMISGSSGLTPLVKINALGGGTGTHALVYTNSADSTTRFILDYYGNITVGDDGSGTVTANNVSAQYLNGDGSGIYNLPVGSLAYQDQDNVTYLTMADGSSINFNTNNYGSNVLSVYDYDWADYSFTLDDGGNMYVGNSIVTGTLIASNAEVISLSYYGGSATTPIDVQSPMTFGGASITGSSSGNPQINLTQTWNTSGTPTLIKATVTNTASNAASKLIDLKVGSTSMFNVTTAGDMSIGGVFNSNGDGLVMKAGGSTALRVVLTGAYSDAVSTAFFQMGLNYAMFTAAFGGVLSRFSVSSNATAISDKVYNAIVPPAGFLHIDRTSVVTSGTTTAVAITPTYNQASGNAANTDLLINRTQTAVGSGTQRFIDCQISGTSKAYIDNVGNVVANAVNVSGSGTNVNNSVIAGDATTPIQLIRFSGHTNWIDMGVTSGKAAGIGHGGAGTNAWIAYAGAASNWFSDSGIGDICYRGTSGTTLRMGIGTASTFQVSSSGVGVTGTVKVTKAITSGVVALTDGATINTDASLGNKFTVTIAGNRTMANPTNPTDGQTIRYRIKQDATGSRLITWGSAFRFSGGSAPTLTTTANKTDYIGFDWNATDSKWDNTGMQYNL